MYERKTKDIYSVEGKYNGEWEEICEEESMKDAAETLQCYMENEPQYPHRIRKRRVQI